MAKFTQCPDRHGDPHLSGDDHFDGEQSTPEFELFIVSSSLLPESRNRLVAEAINWEADYMLWMDADHVFPNDALLRLLSRSRLVVGCNYARRFSPTSPTASKFGDDDEMDLVWTTKEKGRGREMEEVAHLGLGLCLIDMRSFAILEAKALETAKRISGRCSAWTRRPTGSGSSARTCISSSRCARPGSRFSATTSCRGKWATSPSKS
jgi:hypothetical protein